MTEVNKFRKATPRSLFSNGLPILYTVAFLSGISIGTLNPFISAFMDQSGVDEVWIGISSTLYFLALTLATPLVSRLLSHIGLRYTMVFGLILLGVVTPIFPFTESLPLWLIIRIVMGMAVCMYLVTGHTAINYFCDDTNRGTVNGIDAISFVLGCGVGPLLGGSIYDFSPKAAFVLGAFVVLSGAWIVWLGLPNKLVQLQPVRFTHWRKIFLPLQGSFAHGFTIATIVTFMPVYLLSQGYPVAKIGAYFATCIIGGMAGTIILTSLSDRLGRLKILLFSVSLLIPSLILFSLLKNPVFSQISILLVGVGLNAIYPLSLALISSKLPKQDLLSGSALFTLANGLGATTAPIASSLVMKRLGEQSIFLLATICFTFFLLNLARNTMKKSY